MSRDFIAQIIQESAGISYAKAKIATNEIIEAIISQLKREGEFGLVGFGTFRVRRTKARKGRNPATGEVIKVRAGKAVRFKASPTLKRYI
jgi:DNA-binding protein HU-beta